MSRSRRVLIAMSEAGGGHRAVSGALARALEQHYQAEVRIADLIALDPRSWQHRMVRLYPWIIRHAPLLNGLAYHTTNRRRVYGALASRAKERLVPRIARELQAWEPAVVVTTHPFCNRVVLDALDAVGLSIPVVAAVTELVSVHVSWIDPRLSRYTAATEEARLAVLRHGAPPERVTLTGLPVNAAFGRVARPPAEIRRELGLDPDRFTALLVGGGEGAGRLAAQVCALDGSPLNLQLIVVCGRNARLRARLLRAPPRHPAAILGFVDTMPQLVHAADIVVTKGGPTTIAEALVSARPVLVTSVLPGQEEGNDTFVERHGAGYRVGSLSALVRAVARLVEDEPQRQVMAERAARLLRRDAAEAVADTVVAEADRLGRWEAAAGAAPQRS